MYLMFFYLKKLRAKELMLFYKNVKLLKKENQKGVKKRVFNKKKS